MIAEDYRSVIDGALRTLETQGWYHGKPGHGPEGLNGPLCAEYALQCIPWTWEYWHRSQISDMIMHHAWDVICELFPGRLEREDRHVVLVRFNDHPDTTEEDVLLFLKTLREKA